MGDLVRVGVSACFMHADPLRPIFKGKTLVYAELSMLELVMSQGALAVLIPPPGRYSGRDTVPLDAMVADLDGLVLQGGSDVAPETYGEEPMEPRWKGDRIRDLYEIDLVRAFVAANKPVLGICRGMQLINVALGGTLYQDIGTQVPDTLAHRDWDIYDTNEHEIVIEPGSALSTLYGGVTAGRINSVHHQSIKDLAPGLVIEARSTEDEIIEAVRLPQPDPVDPYLAAVQWHPEFSTPETHPHLLDAPRLYQDFMRAVLLRRTPPTTP